MTPLLVLGVVVLVVAGVGLWQRRRAGVVRAVTAGPAPDAALADELAAVGIDGNGPVLLHFSADWCGPCAQVRPLVEQVCAELDGVAHAEVDVVAHPALARRHGVLSLPTVVVLDRDREVRARVSGVPSAADLRAALVPLTGSVRPDPRDAR